MVKKTLKTPQECGVLAEKLIGNYVKQCGAYGDLEALPKVLEMLISKCSLGIVHASSGEVATTVLLRTSLNTAAYADRLVRKAS